MSIPSHLIPAGVAIFFFIIFLVLLAFLVYFTPWYKFRHADYRHVFLGSIAGLIVLWNINAGALPALDFHYVGAMILTLMFGWQYAIWALLLVLLSQIFTGVIDWSSYAINAVFYAFVLIYVANLIYKLVDRKLPDHFFVYIYGAGFFGSAILIVSMVLLTSVYLLITGAYEWSTLVRNYIRYTPLMMFVEAFISGLLITLLVVFRPRWVTTFDDDKYIKGK
ncbi:MAG: energy-coupling factor ABC transporter permease [Gammaproteobacteria bacterium]|nr:energy-coupling factor ABC transporter permease [Gammaproteobacteria bacterium]